jgi:glycosyltransferase involved in cell wall biosynthesis
MRVEFILPIYNEEKILTANVLRLLDYCQKQDFNFIWQIILVVNGSFDSSWLQSQELEKKYPLFIKAVNYVPPGRGGALKKYYLTSTADILVYMDIDLAVDLKNISDLINPIIIGQVDLVIGSRLLPESKIKRSFIREASSQTYNFLSRLILGHHFSDLQCGFKAVRAEAFKKIAPFLKDGRWFFDTELVAFSQYFNYRIKEIPVDWSENRWDQRHSKVNLLRDSLKFVINLLRLKIKLIKTK